MWRLWRVFPHAALLEGSPSRERKRGVAAGASSLWLLPCVRLTTVERGGERGVFCSWIL